MATLVTDKGVPYIEDVWDLNDIRNVANDYEDEEFTEEELIFAMEMVVDDFDANCGINWQVIENALDWIIADRKENEESKNAE